MTQGPRGWTPGLIERRKQRFVADEGPPPTYDETARTVDAILSAGSPVTRFYGREVLAISEAAVDLDRVNNGGIPLLDSHDQSSITKSLGKISQVWFTDQQGEPALAGRISFHATPQGRKAEAMIARREISSLSIGYTVNAWEIADADGRIIDPDYVRWDDSDLVYTATRWTLVEASLVCVPADADAAVRSLSNGHGFDVDGVGMRMAARARMRMRMRAVGMMVRDDE